MFYVGTPNRNLSNVLLLAPNFGPVRNLFQIDIDSKYIDIQHGKFQVEAKEYAFTSIYAKSGSFNRFRNHVPAK